MRAPCFFFLLAGLLFPLASHAEALADDPLRRPATDEEAAAGDALAERLLEAVGQAGYERLRVLSFDFVVLVGGEERVRRHHVWDKHAGLARVAWPTPQGRVEAWLRLADKSGVVTVDGRRLEDAGEARRLLEEGFAAWVNDTYWLVAPFKVRDPGTRRAAIPGGLRLTFDDGVGLTPGDAYLFRLDDEGLPRGWEFLLESGRRGAFTFAAERRVLGALFHLEKRGEEATIRLDRFAASYAPADALFAPLLDERPPVRSR